MEIDFGHIPTLEADIFNDNASAIAPRWDLKDYAQKLYKLGVPLGDGCDEALVQAIVKDKTIVECALDGYRVVIYLDFDEQWKYLVCDTEWKLVYTHAPSRSIKGILPQEILDEALIIEGYRIADQDSAYQICKRLRGPDEEYSEDAIRETVRAIIHHILLAERE